MKTLYFDCFSGISGDMCLAALLDLGVVTADAFLSEMSKLKLDEYNLHITKTSKNAIAATDVEVVVQEHHHAHDHHDHHHGRNMADIAHIIDHSSITPVAKGLAKRIFSIIAEAEAKVHGVEIERVHFHEVGAVDSIVDIVGTAVLMDMLGVERVVCSPLSEGHGFVRCQHGLIPVPVPATAQILGSVGAPVKRVEIESELITPTGAGIVAALAEDYGDMPVMANVRVGYGAGKKDFDTPNLLRVFLGDSNDGADDVVMIETNIDDMTGENAGFVMDMLFDAGALDVFFTPIQMKKSRPGIMLSVLCGEEKAHALEDIIFAQTPTIGLRKYKAQRRVLARAVLEAQTPWGSVRVKVSRFGDSVRVVPEYEDVAKRAREYGIAFDDVYQAAKMGHIHG